MNENDLYALIQQADPQTLQLMMQAGLAPAQNEALQNQKMAQGREVGPHNVFVASSPLEHFANALRERRQQQLIDQQGQGRQAYLKLVAGQGQPSDDPTGMGLYQTGA